MNFKANQVSYIVVLIMVINITKGAPSKGKGAQCLSGRVLESRPRGRRLEPNWRHCVVVFERDTFILAKSWFNPGRPVPT